jgi:hypothetical protein
MSNIGVAGLALAGHKTASLAARGPLALVTPSLPWAHGFVGAMHPLASGLPPHGRGVGHGMPAPSSLEWLPIA